MMSVLMTPQRQAQNLVLTKTRYFGNDGGAENFLNRLKVAGTRTIDDGIRDGTVICGAPETAVKQIKRIHAELGCGWINTNLKIGNVPNDAVIKSMEMMRDYVLPEVRDLGAVPPQSIRAAGE
jgi:alkanesulfonate monooxygenase SsuD/methylene tetrahydromethanopterin reductase-like flavin-dependent oxidoreductase (luciferase family)